MWAGSKREPAHNLIVTVEARREWQDSAGSSVVEASHLRGGVVVMAASQMPEEKLRVQRFCVAKKFRPSVIVTGQPV